MLVGWMVVRVRHGILRWLPVCHLSNNVRFFHVLTFIRARRIAVKDM